MPIIDTKYCSIRRARQRAVSSTRDAALKAEIGRHTTVRRIVTTLLNNVRDQYVNATALGSTLSTTVYCSLSAFGIKSPPEDGVQDTVELGNLWIENHERIRQLVMDELRLQVGELEDTLSLDVALHDSGKHDVCFVGIELSGVHAP